jgi:hypothetical protein
MINRWFQFCFNFAFKFDLRRYNKVKLVNGVNVTSDPVLKVEGVADFEYPCEEGGQAGLTLVHFSAQPEPYMSPKPGNRASHPAKGALVELKSGRA